MSKHNPTWVSLHRQLSHAKRSLSAIEREIHILAQSNRSLLKKNAAWVKAYRKLTDCNRQLQASYNALLLESEAKDDLLECCSEDKSMLDGEIKALKKKVLELGSLTTSFSCDGTSAEDYLNLME